MGPRTMLWVYAHTYSHVIGLLNQHMPMFVPSQLEHVVSNKSNEPIKPKKVSVPIHETMILKPQFTSVVNIPRHSYIIRSVSTIYVQNQAPLLDYIMQVYLVQTWKINSQYWIQNIESHNTKIQNRLCNPTWIHNQKLVKSY